MTPSAVGSLSQETVETLRFLASLYPKGRTLESILDEVKKVYGTSSTVAIPNTKAMLVDYRDNKKIVEEIRTNGKSVIILTEKGKVFVWKFVNELWTNNKTLLFTYLKAWVKMKDPQAISMYKKCASELLSERPEIVGQLLHPMLETSLIEHYARIIEKDIDSDLVADINSYIGVLVNVGFAAVEEQDQGGRMVNVCGLTKEGTRATRMMFDYLKRRAEGKVVSTVPVQSANRPQSFISFLHMIIAVFASVTVMVLATRMESGWLTPDIVAMLVFASILPMILWIIVYLIANIMKKFGIIAFFKKFKK